MQTRVRSFLLSSPKVTPVTCSMCILLTFSQCIWMAFTSRIRCFSEVFLADCRCGGESAQVCPPAPRLFLEGKVGKCNGERISEHISHCRESGLVLESTPLSRFNLVFCNVKKWSRCQDSMGISGVGWVNRYPPSLFFF